MAQVRAKIRSLFAWGWYGKAKEGSGDSYNDRDWQKKAMKHALVKDRDNRKLEKDWLGQFKAFFNLDRHCCQRR